MFLIGVEYIRNWDLLVLFVRVEGYVRVHRALKRARVCVCARVIPLLFMVFT